MNFDRLFDYQAYCNFKDLEGIYCDDCRNWLIYGITSVDKPFYIVSDELEPCSECVKVRRGNYPYLSDFSMFNKAFVKSKNTELKEEILKLFRSNGKERFIKKHISDWKFSGIEIDRFRERYGKTIVLRNKFKFTPNSILSRDHENEVIGHIYSIHLFDRINYNLIKALQQITKIQHERPVMKYIVTKQFGTNEQKQNLYNQYKQSDDLLENVSYEMFWDDFGLHYLMGIEDSIFNSELLDTIEKPNMVMMLHLYDFELHWSERAQHYFKRRYYKPKRFNVHKLGYY